MKTINKYLTILFCLIVTFSFGQDRNVYWAHGLGENSTTWDAMETIFDMERQIDGRSNGYVSQSGVATATADVLGDLVSNYGQAGSRLSNNIGIGHSMGGIVSRNIDVTQTGTNRRFGGIITVGSPNDGIMLANNIANGRVGQAMNHACGEVLAGPTSEIPGVGIIINFIIPEVICDVLSDQLIDPILGSSLSVSGANMSVGSAVMNTINGGGSGIPQISIWGNEESPVHWRLLSSMDTDNANDTKWVTNAEDYRELYQALYISHLSASVVAGVLGFFFPPIWAGAAVEALKAVQWKRGVRWFDRSEGMWNQLMACGGDVFEQVTVTYTNQIVNCNCFGYTGSPEWVNCLNTYCGGTINGCWQTVTTTQEVVVNGQSDGFICENAQIINSTPATNHYRADGANHNEETVHKQVEERIRDAWKRTDFFQTPIR